MDSRLAALAGRQGGAFSAAEAVARGVPEAELPRAVATGELVRVRRGAYVHRRQWDAADLAGRFRLECLAVARTRRGDALSHHAALSLHGLPLWSYDPRRIDLVANVAQGVVRGGLHLHPGGRRTFLVDGLLVVPVAEAVVRTAVTMGFECAVVAGDAALHARLVTEEELRTEVARVSPHQGRKRAQAAVDRMDPAAESVGESRTRMVLQNLGMRYESQKVLCDDHGRFLARVDFLVEGVVLEFDGRIKYQRDGDVDGADAAEVVWREKQREDVIRRQGHAVERVIWPELDRPGLIGARIRAARRPALQHTE
ncbi:hypothetical protein BA895_13305 [Humibacillus sp. DSM 29435]|uniref:type IV toxin-antitoxin system AbiEi family antitoxin domain-containing protein n=1 Tax=Humibacillus sp. DSM 29435 TaxID=1869167 RepID=UPI000871D7B0|nr:type IV toxin-antitoxin system AbiEi family antitoxin domain-containing protein [Humibacillus sp. DSM 29435]OFE18092.1 hypothetical protein BA895_13305 [Humibacillus sp. DSM 29435]